MNGNDRRRMELTHPENTPTSEEMSERKGAAKTILKIGNSICLIFMVFGAYIVASTSVQYRGFTGFSIAFFGILLDVFLGILLAYHLGNKMRGWYTENVIYKYNHIIN